MSNIGIKCLLHMIIFFNFVKILKLWLKENLKLKWTQGKLVWERKITICKLEVKICHKSWIYKTYQCIKRKKNPLLQNK